LCSSGTTKLTENRQKPAKQVKNLADFNLDQAQTRGNRQKPSPLGCHHPPNGANPAPRSSSRPKPVYPPPPQKKSRLRKQAAQFILNPAG
jgi:hypothetical protein